MSAQCIATNKKKYGMVEKCVEYSLLEGMKEGIQNKKVI